MVLREEPFGAVSRDYFKIPSNNSGKPTGLFECCRRILANNFPKVAFNFVV